MGEVRMKARQFEEQFPSLKDKRFSVYSFEPHEVGDKIGAKIEAQSDFTMESEEIELIELSNPITVPITRLVMDCTVQEHCLDKQIAKEIIMEELDEEDYHVLVALGLATKEEEKEWRLE